MLGELACVKELIGEFNVLGGRIGRIGLDQDPVGEMVVLGDLCRERTVDEDRWPRAGAGRRVLALMRVHGPVGELPGSEN